ncbi:MAG: metallophosphoesterase family protein [Halobacteriales archaeon]|nr:metallophosphoesterase family protein [Halobacteriales archaeon]
MSQVAIISDTHIPGRADAIPGPFEERIRLADHVIHAGDVTSPEALATIRDLASGTLVAVAGNMDGTRLRLPTTETLVVGETTFVVTHGTGDPTTYRERVARTVRETAGSDAVGVAGHTHEVLDTVHDGVRLLNPGSVTGAAPADLATMMTATVDADEMTVTVHVDEV